ncbi:MAG: OmpA family protein [Gemmatimonadota bacterium]|nr:OmpA family protein [Gemmatimonadota bacterium]
MGTHARVSSYRRRANVAAVLLAVAALGEAMSGQAPAGRTPRIPLVPGLTLVKAARTREGDYEAMSVVSAISAREVKLAVSGQVPSPGQKPISVNVTRIVRVEDLQSARAYKYYFNPADEPIFAGTTALGTSTAIVTELRSRGEARMAIDGRSGGLVGVVDDLLGGIAREAGLGKALGGGVLATGTFKVVGAHPAFLSVLVNSVKTALPVLHVRGRIGEGQSAEDAEFYFLDDPANPLTLRFAIGADSLEVINIAFPAPDASRTIERELASSRRTAVYGIYFDFNSTTIRPQSQPVLREIRDVLQREPGWRLKIEGHTDNVGSDAKNLDLSARRAAAVKAALVAMGVSDERLDTGGYGASVPREANTTLAGRARNRRVELSRE